jgi:hypothetical protein
MTIELTAEQEDQLLALAGMRGEQPEAIATEIIVWALENRAALAQELIEAREDLAAGRVLRQNRSCNAFASSPTQHDGRLDHACSS